MILTVNWPTAFKCASNLSSISWVISNTPFRWINDFLLATSTAWKEKPRSKEIEQTVTPIQGH